MTRATNRPKIYPEIARNLAHGPEAEGSWAWLCAYNRAGAPGGSPPSGQAHIWNRFLTDAPVNDAVNTGCDLTCSRGLHARSEHECFERE